MKHDSADSAVSASVRVTVLFVDGSKISSVKDLLPLLETVVEPGKDGTGVLKVGWKRGENISHRSRVSVNVTMPKLGSLATAGPLQRTGKIKFIAVTAPKRHPAFPDVPTVAESGGPAGYEVTGWTAVAAPRGLPKAVADKIQKDINEALAEPDIAQRYATFGYEQFPVTRDQFNAFIGSESSKWAGVVQRAKASLD